MVGLHHQTVLLELASYPVEMIIDLKRPLSELYLISGSRVVPQHSPMIWKVLVLHHPEYRYNSNGISRPVNTVQSHLVYTDISM
jgi:hypothetical protein